MCVENLQLVSTGIALVGVLQDEPDQTGSVRLHQDTIAADTASIIVSIYVTTARERSWVTCHATSMLRNAAMTVTPQSAVSAVAITYHRFRTPAYTKCSTVCKSMQLPKILSRCRT